MPLRLEFIEGTAADHADYDFDNFSDNYLRDRALFLQGYLDGMQDETDSLLIIDGGTRVFKGAYLHDRLYIEDFDKI